MATTHPPLPLEILAYILTFLPQRHLLPVILTCHALRNLCEPLLYRHITLSNCPTRSLYLFRTLLAHEELCKHVRTFHPADDIPNPRRLDTLSRVIFGGGRSGGRVIYFGHIARVLGRLCLAENISIPTSTVQFFHSIAPPSRIKKFRSPSYGGIRDLAAFLDVLPDATHFELPLDWFRSQEEWQLQVQSHHVPCLEGLLCPIHVATALVPLRPIKQLFLVWGWGLSEFHGTSNAELMEVMAQGTEVIKSLGLLFGSRANMQSEITHVFRATAQFLPDVEELIVWVKFWKDNSRGLKRSLRELSKSLSSFRKLRTLDFNGSTGWGVPYFDHRRNAISTVYTRILQTWSERCPTLEKVTFPNGMVWIKEPVLVHSKHSKCWPQTFLPVSLPLAPRRRINTMLPGVNDASRDSTLENTSASDNVVPQGDAMSGGTSNIEITTTANPVLPNTTAHADPNQTTSQTNYRWRCLNQYRPRSDRASHSPHSLTRIQRSELGWGEPMFKRDLRGGWPEGLPVWIPP